MYQVPTLPLATDLETKPVMRYAEALKFGFYQVRAHKLLQNN